MEEILYYVACLLENKKLPYAYAIHNKVSIQELLRLFNYSFGVTKMSTRVKLNA